MCHARHSKHGGGTGMWYAVCFWGEGGVVFCCVIFCLVCFCLFLIFALGRFLYEGVFIVDIISLILHRRIIVILGIVFRIQLPFIEYYFLSP